MANPNPSTTWTELLAILLVRLGFLWLLVLVSLLTPHDETAFYALMAIAFIATIPYSLWLRNRLRSNQFAPLQFLVDLVLVTGLVYFTGGVRSDLTLLYPLVILSAGIVATPMQAAKITLLGIVMYILMATLLSKAILVEYLPAGQEASSSATFTSLWLRSLTFALFGVLSIYVSKRCDYIKRHGHDAQNAIIRLIEGLSANILVLDRDGQILMANPAACDILRTTADALCGRRFTEISDPEHIVIPKSYGPSTCLSRHGHPHLPVGYCRSDIQLPAAALPELGAEEEIAVTLVVFTDLSEALAMERRLNLVEHISAATRIAGEMAHEIRTPLTSISASIQLLKHYEEKSTSADWLPNSRRRKDRAELFEHITSAYNQMNSVIQHFIDFAEFSPKDLISIIKLDSIDENQGYIGQFNTISKGCKNGQNSDSGRRSDDS